MVRRAADEDSARRQPGISNIEQGLSKSEVKDFIIRTSLFDIRYSSRGVTTTCWSIPGSDVLSQVTGNHVIPGLSFPPIILSPRTMRRCPLPNQYLCRIPPLWRSLVGSTSLQSYLSRARSSGSTRARSKGPASSLSNIVSTTLATRFAILTGGHSARRGGTTLRNMKMRPTCGAICSSTVPAAWTTGRAL